MFIYYRLICLVFISLFLLPTPLWAEPIISPDLQIEGNMRLSAGFSPSYVMVEKIRLSARAKENLSKRATYFPYLTTNFKQGIPLPSKIDLGMNGVPVLDQGLHGTCVTFAMTAALDAIISQGDYISQLCNLELGEYLALQDPAYPSGWEGSYGDIVLNQIKKYGAISQTYQKYQGCAGTYTYPAQNQYNIGNPMSGDAFSGHSEAIMQNVTWQTLLSSEQSVTSVISSAKLLQAVKQALQRHHRVVGGFFLDVNNGGAGNFGTYHVPNDSWIIVPSIQKDIKQGNIMAGHEMVIAGYDDNAILTGPNHIREKGAFLLRNSWGMTGDQGTYYVSYHYFQKMVMEIHEIITH